MNLLRMIFGGVKEIDTDQYHRQFDHQPHLLLDVRNPNEFDGGHITGATNIPLAKLPKKLEKLPDDRPIVCVSRSGLRGRDAAYLLQKAGYEVANLVGGVMEWRDDGGDLVKT